MLHPLPTWRPTLFYHTGQQDLVGQSVPRVAEAPAVVALPLRIPSTFTSVTVNIVEIADLRLGNELRNASSPRATRTFTRNRQMPYWPYHRITNMTGTAVPLHPRHQTDPPSPARLLPNVPSHHHVMKHQPDPEYGTLTIE